MTIGRVEYVECLTSDGAIRLMPWATIVVLVEEGSQGRGRRYAGFDSVRAYYDWKVKENKDKETIMGNESRKEIRLVEKLKQSNSWDDRLRQISVSHAEEPQEDNNVSRIHELRRLASDLRAVATDVDNTTYPMIELERLRDSATGELKIKYGEDILKLYKSALVAIGDVIGD